MILRSLILLPLLLSTPLLAELRVVVGGYTGDGVMDRKISTSLTCKVVVVLGNSASQMPVMRMDSIPGDASIAAQGTGGAGLIKTMVSDGFTVGTDANVNANGAAYHYACLAGTSVETGSYVGNGVDDRNITTTLTPKFVMLGAIANKWVYKLNSQPATLSYINDADSAANRIQAFNAPGFQVGTDAAVNTDTVTYYYWLTDGPASYYSDGTYTGDGNDDRDITAGFQPLFALSKKDAVALGVVRLSSMTSGDSKGLLGEVYITTGIKSFGATTFRLGTETRVNALGGVYYWAAFADQTPAAGRRRVMIISP